jgi:hypothetical protein
MRNSLESGSQEQKQTQYVPCWVSCLLFKDAETETSRPSGLSTGCLALEWCPVLSTPLYPYMGGSWAKWWLLECETFTRQKLNLGLCSVHLAQPVVREAEWNLWLISGEVTWFQHEGRNGKLGSPDRNRDTVAPGDRFNCSGKYGSGLNGSIRQSDPPWASSIGYAKVLSSPLPPNYLGSPQDTMDLSMKCWDLI